MRAAAIDRMSEADYLDYDLAHEGKHEWVNGDVVAMAGVTPAHDAIQVNLVAALATRLRGTPCRTHSADLRVRIGETRMYAYPDLSVHCGRAEYADTHPPTLLNPTLIVEVLSESTEDYDRGAKAAHYRERASVAAIVLVDSRSRSIETQTRNADGTWTLAKHTGGELRLAAIGVAVPFEEIYAGVEGVG
jgi:Uma2 family endonuclease